MANKFQRKGSKSNSDVGRKFEECAKEVITKKIECELKSELKIELKEEFSIPIGIAKNRKKEHKFDLGSKNPAVLVECKSHKWTEGGNVPSAKITNWNQAMYYFHCAPSEYRKIMFVLRDSRKHTKETLAEYYIRTNAHLIPDDVEFWEYDEKLKKLKIWKYSMMKQ